MDFGLFGAALFRIPRFVDSGYFWAGGWVLVGLHDLWTLDYLGRPSLGFHDLWTLAIFGQVGGYWWDCTICGLRIFWGHLGWPSLGLHDLWTWNIFGHLGWPLLGLHDLWTWEFLGAGLALVALFRIPRYCPFAFRSRGAHWVRSLLLPG